MIHRLHPLAHKGLDLLVCAQMRSVVQIGPKERLIEYRRERLGASDAQAETHPAHQLREVFAGGYIAFQAE
jgi:hypothetical protein